MGNGSPGGEGDDAVLCTNDLTYALRAVTLSNTVAIGTSPLYSSDQDFAEDALVIEIPGDLGAGLLGNEVRFLFKNELVEGSEVLSVLYRCGFARLHAGKIDSLDFHATCSGVIRILLDAVQLCGQDVVAGLEYDDLGVESLEFGEGL